MRKRLFLMLCVFLVIACCNQPEPLSLKIDKAKSVVFQVTDGVGGIGSGFHIGNNLVLTAHHVIDPIDSPSYILYDNQKFETQILKYDEELDLAILLIIHDKILIPEALKISTKAPVSGDIIWSIGYHFGNPQMKTCSQGNITGRSDSEGIELDKTIYDAAMNMGCSGGPVLNENFEVIGVNQRGWGPFRGTFAGLGGMNYYEHFIEFMEEFRK